MSCLGSGIQSYSVAFNQMTKGVKKPSVKGRVCAIRSGMPFDSKMAATSSTRLPKSWQAKQRTWMLAGLRKIHAPVVTWPFICFKPSVLF